MKNQEQVIKILIACEESQTVCLEFRKLGHKAYSCDVLEQSGGHPEWHIKGDALAEAYSGKYDLMIAHPPCTYMSNAGARWMYPTAGNLCPKRYRKSQEAKIFLIRLLNAPIKHVAVENPLPLKIVGLPTPSQIIQPYQFGEPYSKKTLLWIKNLPNLKTTDILTEYKTYMPSNTGGVNRGQKHQRGVVKNQKEASKTFTGIAKSMAEQWGEFILKGEGK